MSLCPKVRLSAVSVLLVPILALAGGCGSQAPTDKATEQEQLKQLDEARQREWNNQ